jgi:hypothetical protein
VGRTPPSVCYRLWGEKCYKKQVSGMAQTTVKRVSSCPANVRIHQPAPRAGTVVCKKVGHGTCVCTRCFLTFSAVLIPGGRGVKKQVFVSCPSRQCGGKSTPRFSNCVIRPSRPAAKAPAGKAGSTFRSDPPSCGSGPCGAPRRVKVKPAG